MPVANEVIKIGIAEEGYLEKQTNAYLDDKTKNAGKNNYTKYARDYFPSLQGQAWCGIFVGWCFIKAFSKSEASKLLGGLSTAYTPTFAQQFKNMKRWHTKDPKAGDVIFFKNSQRICHTGIVTKVDRQYVYTVEGNTSGASTVVANGGGVHQKKYALTLARIAGYGRPAYVEQSDIPSPDTPFGPHVPLNYQVGQTYTVQAAGLNVRTKKSADDPDVLPNGKIINTLKCGDHVKNQATTLVKGKIWMYIGLDSKKREMWCCADSGSVSYIA